MAESRKTFNGIAWAVADYRTGLQSPMFEWADDLKLAGSPLHFDSRIPRRACFVSHAHSDHLAVHAHAIATPPTSRLAEHRIGTQKTTELGFDTPFDFEPDTRLTLFSAGHVLGSAMLRVENAGGTLLYTGDFKLRRSLTVPVAQPVRADVLVMECTYGQPHFRFPPWQQTADRLVSLVTAAMKDGRQPVVMGYSLGKAQEITRILTDAGLVVTAHGAVWAMNAICGGFGCQVGPARKYVAADFHGAAALPLQDRGVLVAPPQVARSGFVTRFDNPLRIMMSGWGLLKNAQYRYGVDHVLPLSDHADFDELLEMVEIVQPKKIYTHHGFRSFAQELRNRGHDATPAKPDGQLLLFGDI
jgi:Cft2 family RNA processing exonuclease